MPNIVKLMAVIDGSSTPVGSCHPGQARLLQKKGMASWHDGKLWLLDPSTLRNIHINVEGTPVRDVLNTVNKALREAYPPKEVGHTEEYEAKGHPVAHDPIGMALSASARKALSEVIGQPPLVDAPIPVGRTGMVVRPLPDEDVTPAVPADLWVRPPLGLSDEALLEAGVEPGEWQDKIKFRSQSPPRTKDCEVSSFRTLLREYLRRVGLGHTMHAYDDHQSRMVGFIDEEGPEYVCVSLTRSGLAGLTDDDATPFGMSLTALLEMLRTPAGREGVFGKWASEGSGEEPADDPCIEWGDGGYPEVPPEFFLHLPVGADYVVPPVDLTSKDGESPADRAAAVAQERASQPRPPRRVTGWTSFRWPEAHTCIPVTVAGPTGDNTPHPPLLEDGVPPVVRYGTYRRVGRHLLRVWADGGWDESILQDDGSYRLVQSREDENKRMVEKRISEVSDGDSTRHEFSGWTPFHTDKSALPPVFYMDLPAGAVIPPHERPFTEEEIMAIKSQMVRKPFPDPEREHYQASYGMFRVVGDRLFRVWNEKGQCSWDESVRAQDGTYDLVGEGRSIDQIYGMESLKCDLLSPSGFPENVRAAERRIAEYLGNEFEECLAEAEKRVAEVLHGGGA